MAYSFLRLLDPLKIDPYAYDQNNLSRIKKYSLLGGGRIGWNYPMDYSFIAEMFEELSNKNKIKPGMTFIDIGCGPGAIHGYLEAKYGITLIGVDMKRWREDYVDVRGDFLDIEVRRAMGIELGSVDGFISVSALEHLPLDKNKKVLKVCKEYLKAGGFILATASTSKTHSQSLDQTNYSQQELENIYQAKFESYDYDSVFKRWRAHKELMPAYQARYKRPSLNSNEPAFLTFGYCYIKPHSKVKAKSSMFLRNISDYRDFHKDQRCFVVGNGPSLKKTNLELMKKDISIGMNRIALIYPKTSWRPAYYTAMTDNINGKSWRKDATVSVDEGIPSFINSNYKKFFTQTNIHFLNCKGHGERMPSYPDSFWSYDIVKGVTKYGSTILVSLEIAVYLGFKEIYLIGCDLGFVNGCQDSNAGTDSNHFSADYGTPGCTGDMLNHNMHQAHILAKRMADRVGVKIINATVGGNLSVYPRVKYEELF